MSRAGAIDDVARVREATDIVDVVAAVVALKPKGREFVGLCPFHDDNNPSMYVVPQKQLFHCFVCGAGGDAFTFVQRFHRMEFREALEHLAAKAGVELTRRAAPDTAGDERGVSRRDLLRANEAAARFFRAVLVDEGAGATARGTIARRGIADAMVERFILGAAPEGWDGLARRLEGRGFDTAAYEGAGLIRRRDGGGHYDVFRHRLMFPIRDAAGRVVAFGGRRLCDEDSPKYLNSAESAVFDKSSALFGLHEASAAIRRARVALVTEGYTDTIACHQAGVEHAVATLGTALTAGHARALRRLADTVVLLFDGDEAGHRAADRAVEVFFAEPIDVKIATLSRFTDAKDPDELLKREQGRATLDRVIAHATDLLDYRFERLADSVAGAGMAALERAATDELERLAALGLGRVSPMRRELVIRRISAITGLSAQTVAKSIPAGRGSPQRAAEPASAPHRGPARMGPRETALACVLLEPTLAALATPEQWRAMVGATYPLPEVVAISRAMAELHEQGLAPGLAAVLGAVDAVAAEQAVGLHERVRRVTSGDPERVAATWRDCVRELLRSAEPADAGSAAEALAALRARRERLGDDPRRLPRVS